MADLTRAALIDAMGIRGIASCPDCRGRQLDAVLPLIADAIDQAAGVTSYRTAAKEAERESHVSFPLPIGMQAAATAADLVRSLMGDDGE